MRSQVFRAEQRIARPLPEVFEFFSRAGNLERITPPWLSFSILGDEPAEVTTGTVIPYRLRLHGLPLRLGLADRASSSPSRCSSTAS